MPSPSIYSKVKKSPVLPEQSEVLQAQNADAARPWFEESFLPVHVQSNDMISIVNL